MLNEQQIAKDVFRNDVNLNDFSTMGYDFADIEHLADYVQHYLANEKRVIVDAQCAAAIAEMIEEYYGFFKEV